MDSWKTKKTDIAMNIGEYNNLNFARKTLRKYFLEAIHFDYSFLTTIEQS